MISMHKSLAHWPLTLAALLTLSPGCETFDGPPEPSLPDAQAGLLSSPDAPLRVLFSKPIDPESLKLLVVPLQTNEKDQLPDEIDGATLGESIAALKPIFVRDPVLSSDYGGNSRLELDNQLFVAELNSRLPVGQRLAVLVEPGLINPRNGITTNVRRRLPFSVDFKCNSKPTQLAKSGPYFFLLNVEEPLQLQVQLFAWLEINEETGEFIGQFSNADRLANEGKCPSACSGATSVCRTLPSAECVAPSENAGAVEEWRDFFVQTDPSLAYGVTVRGCVEDQEGASTPTFALATAPASLQIPSPPVSIDALVVVSSMLQQPDGTFRGDGSGSTDNVRLGSGDLGRASGTILGLSLPPELAPTDIPRPPVEAE